mgnify:CR=1 FL=1
MAVLITTSHRPSQRIRSFCSDIEASSDFFIYATRGKQTFLDLASLARLYNADCVILVCSTKGNPGKLDFYQFLGSSLLRKLSLILKGIKLTREMGLKVTRTKRRPVFITAPKQGEVLNAASAIARLIGVPLITEGQLNIGLNIAFKEGINELLTIHFLDASSRVPCGPLIRVKSFHVW